MKDCIQALVVLMFIVGCQKKQEIQIKMDNKNLVFYSEKLSGNCKKGIFIYDLGVQFIGKDDKKVAWAIVRKSRVGQEVGIFDLPLIYGSETNGISTQSKAIELASGKYNFSGTVLCLTNDDGKSISINGFFSIDESGIIGNQR